MFEWAKNILFESIKEEKELDETIELCACKFESDANDCSLIQQLKEKQKLEKSIKNDIESYDNHNFQNVQYLRWFLMKLEKNGFKMDIRYGYGSSTSNIDEHFKSYGTTRLERVFDDCSLDDIKMLSSELVAFKQRNLITEEKKAALKSVEKDISDIKAKLGIE